MNLLRTLLFLAVPFSGIALWRVWWRETRPLSVFVGGSVIGLAAFWLMLRITALVLPFSRATWLSLAVVTIAGGVAARRWPTVTEWRAEDHRYILGFLVAFALLFALSVYSAAGALFSFDEVMTHHLPLTASMQRGNFPPIDLREPPHALEYHWGQHLLAAGVSQITGLAPWQTLFGLNALLAGLAFLLAYALARREATSFASTFGALLLVAGGTLNWLSAWRFDAPFDVLMNPLGQPFTTGNTLMGGFFWRLHTNSTTWPVCLLLLATDVLWRGTKKRSPSLLALAAVLLALVAPGSETMLCAAVTGWLAACVVAQRAISSWQFIAVVAATAVCAALLAPLMGGTLASFFRTGSASHQAHVIFNRAHFGFVPSWNAAQWFADPPWLPLLSWRFLQDAGPVPFLLLPVLGWAWWKTKPRLLTMTLIALASLTAATALTLTHYPANMFRLVNHAVVLGALPAGAALATLFEKYRATRGLVITAFVVLLASWPLSHVGLFRQQQGHQQGQLAWPSNAAASATLDFEAINWLRTHTDFRDGLLPLPIERWDVLAAGQAHPLGSFVGGRTDYAARAKNAAEKLDLESLTVAQIRYVYVVRKALPEAVLTRLNEATAQGWLQMRWQNASAERAIYAVIPATRP